MLKVSRVETPDNGAVLLLEGRVHGAWVSALRESCEDALAAGPASLLVDLAGVTFVTTEGADMLRALPRDRVRLVNASPLVLAQLHLGGST